MKLVVLQGHRAPEALAVSRELCAADDTMRRVNFRLLNKMLNYSRRGKKRVAEVKEAMEFLVADALLKEKNVVIDSAQITTAEVEKWRVLAASFGAAFEVINKP